MKSLFESPLDCKEINPVHPKGNQSWIFIGRIESEAETPVLWPPDAKIWRIGKDPDAGKDWRREEKEMTEDEMVRWHHWLDGHEFEQLLGDSDGQGSLACCSPWGCKESDTTEQLNWTDFQASQFSYNCSTSVEFEGSCIIITIVFMYLLLIQLLMTTYLLSLSLPNHPCSSLIPGA